MGADTKCVRRILTSGRVSKIEQCVGCDHVHLHVGCVTLRLEVAAFHSLVDDLLQASIAMVEAPEERRLHS
ncbi:MAG: hypothetical protein RMA76_37340 [Deltaproteobacteria bacterium]|jgi:hypothetical protein